MNKVNPNMNSFTINPLSVTKPEYKDPTIEDIYIVRGEEDYIYGKGYIQNYDVIIVKRVTPDMVRKFAYAFNHRDEAIDFMRSLYDIGDVQAILSEEEVIMDKDIAEPEKACTTEIKEPTNKNFSFGDEDEVNFRNEMHRLKELPIATTETGINKPMKFGNVQVGKGIL